MEGKLLYPDVFTLLGFEINSLIDKGETISLDEIRNHIRNRTIWDLLEDKLTNRLLSIYDEDLRNEFLNYFESCDNALSSSDFGIYNNGYCLLLSYLFEAIQERERCGWFTSIEYN